MSRREFLSGAGAATAAALLGACGGSGDGERKQASSPPAGAPPDLTTGGLRGYAFGVKAEDVTVFDVTTRRAVQTKQLGAAVRWLSNEQRFWDGRYIWTYDFPDDRVGAIAIDPRSLTVARTILTGGRGPAHSLMLTPDRATAWVNVAGDDELAVIDLASGQVTARVPTGKFP